MGDDGWEPASRRESIVAVVALVCFATPAVGLVYWLVHSWLM